MPPLFGLCHTLPVLHRLIEKVLTRLGTEQVVSSWSLLLSHCCGSAVVITKLHFILCWLGLSCIWFGVSCVLALQLYSFLPLVFVNVIVCICKCIIVCICKSNSMYVKYIHVYVNIIVNVFSI